MFNKVFFVKFIHPNDMRKANTKKENKKTFKSFNLISNTRFNK